ncbi:MAG: hypothetical protein WA040_05215 [Anaerolineae bacterium]
MSNQPNTDWQPDTITLTTAHSASSYGVPVLVIDGDVYGPDDLLPNGQTAAHWLRRWLARFDNLL